MTPANPGRASVRSSTDRTRTDLLATRTGTPPARRTRSSAFAHSAGSSSTASGADRVAVAESRREKGPVTSTRMARRAVRVAARQPTPYGARGETNRSPS